MGGVAKFAVRCKMLARICKNYPVASRDHENGGAFFFCFLLALLRRNRWFVAKTVRLRQFLEVASEFGEKPDCLF
jgi:hypothetical protein